ncbi:histidine kinase [Nocardioides sp.]|uniref:sensor histidine kinase n=1 Tax=Nocardioides sp. TaxID=35761 RepID=UPI001A24B7EE|nr:histidine kinase [Nocardioides sp.]MBJ7356175.1 hypothetical protein [Nocardioides sp.]
MPTLRRVSTTARRAGSSVIAAAAAGASLSAVAVVQRADAWDLEPAPQIAVDAAVGTGFPLVAVLALLSPALPTGARTLTKVLLVCGAAAAAAALTTALAVTAPDQTPWARTLVQLQSWLWVPGFIPLLTLVPLLYPSGLRPGRVWRLAAAAAVAGIVALALGVALYPEPFHGTVTMTKPVTSEPAAQALTLLAALLLVPAAVAGLASLMRHLLSSRGLERRQVAVLLSAAGILLAVTAAQGAIPWPGDVLAQAAAVVLMPVAIGVAVTRHGLYELDVAVRRAVVVASLAVCLAGLYLSLLAVVQAGLGMNTPVGAALAAGATGAAIQPLARRLSAGVDRLYYGDRAEPMVILGQLGTELADAPPDMETVPTLVCRIVVDSLRLPGAALHLDGGDPDPAAAVGETHGLTTTAFALRHRGDDLGSLVVAHRAGESELDPRDAAVVGSIATQAAPALAALHLHRQLQRSRESLVSARESERRSLRRDLHDGLGATLAGLRLQIESAQALVDEPAAGILQRASAGVGQAVGEVRSLVDGLRPPGIDDLGLARSLRLLGERTSTPDLAVQVLVDDDLDVGPAAEAATYRIVAEGLANVAKHARATRALVEVTRSDSELSVVVDDDGSGLGGNPGDPADGVGLGSMRERAEELGGHLGVTMGPDGCGTRVSAVIPLDRTEAR